MRSLLPIILASLIVAAGCSKNKDVEPPAKIVAFPAKLEVKKLWGDGVGGGKKQIKLRLGLGPALDKDLVFAASDKGHVVAVELNSGKTAWLKSFKKTKFSAGPAAGFGIVVVGTSKGQIYALDESTGKQVWESHVNSELLSAPAIGENQVVMRSVDGRLHAFNTHTGAELWSVEQQVPKLSLRGTATPVIAKEVAISGFDNGKVMAVSLNNGDTVWDTALAAPHGRTELDRLVDIDSAVEVVGDNVFATGYQGRTAMLALDSGQIWWSHDMSSYRGLAADEDNLYVTESDGELIALRQKDGAELWRNDKVRRRALSAPVVLKDSIALADYQGYVHFFDKASGELIGRSRVSKQRVSSAPVGKGDVVVVMTDGGSLAAFRTMPKAGAVASTPAPAAAPTAPAEAPPAPPPTSP
jgi:outer membrane protein assembly factor BamB